MANKCMMCSQYAEARNVPGVEVEIEGSLRTYVGNGPKNAKIHRKVQVRRIFCGCTDGPRGRHP